MFLNGTYTADIAGCNWTCEHCWSKYGWRGLELDDFPRGGGEMTSKQVAEKLVKGMFRNMQPMCRISGGEASMYWEPHMVGVIREVLGRTQGQRMRIRGKTEPGVDAGCVVGPPGLAKRRSTSTVPAVRSLSAPTASEQPPCRLRARRPERTGRRYRKGRDALVRLLLHIESEH